MIDLLGMVVFGTIVGIGLLDGRRGLSVFALYHSDGVTGPRAATEVEARWRREPAQAAEACEVAPGPRSG